MTHPEADLQDREIAIKVQKGDRDAFALLVGRYQSRIYGFTYHFFREPDLAQEMTQETFLRVYRFIKRYDSDKKLSTWIFSIAKNICIDEKRRLDRSRTVSIEDLPPGDLITDEGAAHLRDPSEIALQMEDRMILEEAVALLPEKYRLAIILFYFQELPYQEIAEILGLSINLVKVRIFRAKKRLLEILTARK